MSLLSKGKLYLRTVSHLKPSQVVYRLWRRLGGTTPLRRGHRVKGDPSCADIGRIPLLQELDFDTVFLKRFSPDDIVRGRIELLNCGVSIDWGKPWLCEEMSALWKFNLHYCEFVLPLAKAACGAGSDKYVEGGKDIISSWISVHPRSAGGAPWDRAVSAEIQRLPVRAVLPSVRPSRKGHFGESLLGESQGYDIACRLLR